jgi:uncharacterized protein YozE (UPF0346 family)
MGGEKMTFYKFVISKYLKSNSPEGDLARDMEADKDFPRKATTKRTILNYLESCHACDDAITVFLDLWKEYTDVRTKHIHQA